MWGWGGLLAVSADPVPQSATLLGLPVAALLRVVSAPAACATPPTFLDECFFFISFVVGLPCSSVFCQFWLFFVFKLLLSFFWLWEEAQCVYLCLHLGRKLRVGFRGTLRLFFEKLCLPLPIYLFIYLFI